MQISEVRPSSSRKAEEKQADTLTYPYYRGGYEAAQSIDYIEDQDFDYLDQDGYRDSEFDRLGDN